MCKLIGLVGGILLLPIIVLFAQLIDFLGAFKTTGPGWGTLPPIALFGFPPFYAGCLLAGVLGFFLGWLIDVLANFITRGH